MVAPKCWQQSSDYHPGFDAGEEEGEVLSLRQTLAARWMSDT